MIVLGVILLIIGYLLGISILWTIGVILLVVGLVLMLMGRLGHGVGGRRHYYKRREAGRRTLTRDASPDAAPGETSGSPERPPQARPATNGPRPGEGLAQRELLCGRTVAVIDLQPGAVRGRSVGRVQAAPGLRVAQ